MQSLSQKLSITRNKIFNAVAAIFNSWSLSFDGVDDYVNIGHDNSIHPKVVASFSIWVKLPDWDVYDSTYRDIFSCYRYKNGYRIGWQAKTLKFAIRVDDGTVAGKFREVSSDYNLFGPTGALFYRASGWHNIVGVFDGNEIRLYIDGVYHKSTSTIIGGPTGILYQNNNNNADLLLAATPSNLSGPAGASSAINHLECKLDEFSIWDTVLSETTITTIFNNGVPFDLSTNSNGYNDSAQQIGYWRAEEGGGIEISDSNTNGILNTGYLINGVSFDSETPS